MVQDDDFVGCGISRLWATPETDPFFNACKVHDAFYSKEWKTTQLTRKDADRILLNSMLQVAKDRNSLKLKARAYLYYFIARSLGWIYWN